MRHQKPRPRTVPLDPRGSESGAALIITLLVTMIVFSLGAALSTTMMAEISTSANYRNSGAALWQAESGLERTASWAASEKYTSEALSEGDRPAMTSRAASLARSQRSP